ncbi:MAG: hypothetical protein ACLGIG_08435 [Actinomycetes bacterium]
MTVPVATADLAQGSAAAARPARRSPLRALRDGLLAVLGAVLGLAPHVLHHVGFLAGTALVAGSGGTALFGAVGLVASIPVVLRLRRRFGTWLAPALGLAVFAAMFTISTLVVGPAISGADDPAAPAEQGAEHDEHHT